MDAHSVTTPLSPFLQNYSVVDLVISPDNKPNGAVVNKWKKQLLSFGVSLRKRAAREKERAAREEERAARVKAEQQLQPNTLLRLLDRCHQSLSPAIRVETNASLTTQGDATNPVNRLYPQRLVPWLDFPRLQEQVWKKLDRTNFTSRPLSPSDTQIDFVSAKIKGKRIYSEVSLRSFEEQTVDTFFEEIVEQLRNDDTLRQDFGIQGQVMFYDRLDRAEASPENSLGQMRLENTSHSGQRGVRERERPMQGPHRRRNRRADQFCVHLVANERLKPVYAVEFKAPHKMTIPELVAGLHQMDLARDVINQEGETFEFYATRLVAAVITQIFSYMIDSGVNYGYICTGEAFVFLHIPEDDPTVVQYFLCIPNQDVQADDENCLHRTAVGQVLAFTIQALCAEAPSQEWHDVAQNTLLTWEVEYMNVLRDIPETIRKDPPASNYRPSHWKKEPKTHNTRSRARCQEDISTPKHSLAEDSDSDEESSSPSTAAAARSRLNRSQRNKRQLAKGSERSQAGQTNKKGSQKDGQSTRPYCSIACIRGITNRGPLDKNCPNWYYHGSYKHSMGPQEFIRRLHAQLAQNRTSGFDQLHICGRTGYLLKATLLSHGYTVVIKATTAEKQHHMEIELKNYRRLKSIQGQQIPVCLGSFAPRVPYCYHGELMAQMMVLSWSGRRLQFAIKDENREFFHRERDNALAVLRSHGVVHGDNEWRNMLWDDLSSRFIVIDLEDMKWVKRSRALKPTSGNARHDEHIKAGNHEDS